MTKLGQYVFAGKEAGALSDHAVLSIDISFRAVLADAEPVESASREP